MNTKARRGWRHVLVAAGLAGATLGLRPAQADDWPALRDEDLAVASGSVLDFSGFHKLRPITEADALVIDANGEFKVRSTGERRRFLIAALGLSNITGGFPPEDEAQAWVDQVVRRGYNMVRLDFVEDVLMNRRTADLDPDPVQLRRLQHLLSRLRAAGVYYILNLMSSDNGAYGGVHERWRPQKDLIARMYTQPDAMAHWQAWVQKVYGATNPFTGQSLLKDPALAGVALLNESGLNMVTRKGTPPGIEAQWRAWMDQQTSLPSPPNWRPMQRNDAAWQTWLVSREARMAQDLSQFVRDQGFKGAITLFNNWLSPAASFSRARLQWIDVHNYAAEPDQWVTPGSRLKSVSMIDQKGGYLLDLAATRVWGKPFTATEYGQVFWDPKRREHLLMGPALAAFQGWQGIGQHSRAIELAYGQKGGFGQIRPFLVGMDPISRAGDVIAAALYGRGDVQPSKVRWDLQLTERYALHETGPLWAVSRQWAQLALVGGIGLRMPGAPSVPQAIPLTLKTQPDNETPGGAQWVERLRKEGKLPASNRTRFDKGQFQSDTGELWLDAGAGVFSVQTPHFEGITLQRGGSFGLSSLTVSSATQGVTVALFSPERTALSAARRLLLVVCTDARNTGMQFRDPQAEVLAQVGTLPVRIEPIQVSLRMTLQPLKWVLYPVSMNGRRHQPVPIQVDHAHVQIALDTQKLPQGPVLFFELVPQP
ncbi:MAG: hypothetical protein RLZZ182_2145 [Pseudomonadota bacterium]|jgi:hypothetical protein